MAISNATLAGLTRTQLLEMHYMMSLLRRFEEKSAEEYTRGKIGGFMHLYIGQEAVGVGSMATLGRQDKVLSSYREHGQAIIKGVEPGAVMAELFGKMTGCSKGKGGSMHMWSNEVGMFGGNAIVAAQLPIAAGIAFAAQYQGQNSVTMCFFGDGAVDEGAFHESLNLASLWKLPVVYICENNQYSMGMAVEKAWAVDSLLPRAAAYNMPGEQIDGMDVIGGVRGGQTRRRTSAERPGPNAAGGQDLPFSRALHDRPCLLSYPRRRATMAHYARPHRHLREEIAGARYCDAGRI